MIVKLYFETMASGMEAKLSPRYRITSANARNLVELAKNQLDKNQLVTNTLPLGAKAS